LVKQGFVYIAQPPLYQITRKKRVEYVDDDAQLNKDLDQLGTEEVELRNLADGKRTQQQTTGRDPRVARILGQIFASAQAHGGDLAEYLEKRDPQTGELARHLVKVRSGNEETVQYFHTERGPP
jgi:DNA gyrase subunit B